MPIIKSTSQVKDQEVIIYVEGDTTPDQRSPYEELRGEARNVLSTARDVFGEGLALARNCAVQVVESIRMMDESVRPEEFQVELSIKLDTEVGAIIAKTSAGAQLQVSMKWVRQRSS